LRILGYSSTNRVLESMGEFNHKMGDWGRNWETRELKTRVLPKKGVNGKNPSVCNPEIWFPLLKGF
jgi:hypothetical protein